MLSGFTDTAILAKVRAMYGQRLTPEDYMELLHKQTVGDAASYLKNETHYREVLAQVQEAQIHRVRLEQLVQMEIYRQYQRLLCFHKSGNAFYDYILRDIEIKMLIQRIGLYYAGTEVSQETVSSLPTYLEKRLAFNLIDLARARNFEEMLKVLARTEYEKVLRPLLPPPGGRPDLLACEHALKTFYFDGLFRKIDQNYRGSTRRDLYTIFSTQLELLNVAAILRMKRFRQYSPKDIQNQLLPARSRLNEKLWKEMIRAATPEEAMGLLARSPYAKYVDGTDYTYIEYTVSSIRYQLSRRFMVFATGAPTVVASFMVLSNLERENITNIIEGIRYGVSPDEIEKIPIR